MRTAQPPKATFAEAAELVQQQEGKQGGLGVQSGQQAGGQAQKERRGLFGFIKGVLGGGESEKGTTSSGAKGVSEDMRPQGSVVRIEMDDGGEQSQKGSEMSGKGTQGVQAPNSPLQIDGSNTSSSKEDERADTRL